jgi:hypothetical protein
VFDTSDKTYSLDKKIDYFTVRSMVIQSLEKIVREEIDRHIASINLHKIIDCIQEDDEEDIIIANTSTSLVNYQDDDNDKALLLQTNWSSIITYIIEGMFANRN